MPTNIRGYLKVTVRDRGKQLISSKICYRLNKAKVILSNVVNAKPSFNAFNTI